MKYVFSFGHGIMRGVYRVGSFAQFESVDVTSLRFINIRRGLGKWVNEWMRIRSGVRWRRRRKRKIPFVKVLRWNFLGVFFVVHIQCQRNGESSHSVRGKSGSFNDFSHFLKNPFVYIFDDNK